MFTNTCIPVHGYVKLHLSTWYSPEYITGIWYTYLAHSMCVVLSSLLLKVKEETVANEEVCIV